MSPNKIVITGTIGSGKSALSSIIRELGFVVIDSDQVNKKLLEKGQANYEAIKKDPFFRKAFENEDLDKNKLAKMIFASPDLMTRLNKLTHPNIMAEIERQIGSLDEKNVFVEIPLFYQMEAKFDPDLILFVRASEEIQIKRLTERDGINELYAKSKIATQEKSINAKNDGKIIIDNDGSIEELRAKIIEILRTENIL
ncbi:dephospho-CoA kinase [Anaerococcus sp. NML200537]|uniref:dephospho-CoA kinase n=1 Tax=Anaerococcus sp. NML200537 TaxID=2954485 RepID=UPI002238026A|nr:dephospho-CoA kinase [Anaerococcus sp. NML200537]MCW6701663.1 dephospho-CoA kinase [Anaerococcus sp. NML200537]